MGIELRAEKCCCCSLGNGMVVLACICVVWLFLSARITFNIHQTEAPEKPNALTILSEANNYLPVFLIQLCGFILIVLITIGLIYSLLTESVKGMRFVFVAFLVKVVLLLLEMFAVLYYLQQVERRNRYIGNEQFLLYDGGKNYQQLKEIIMSLLATGSLVIVLQYLLWQYYYNDADKADMKKYLLKIGSLVKVTVIGNYLFHMVLHLIMEWFVYGYYFQLKSMAE